VFEKRVLRRIFGPKIDKVRGGWRELQNEELHNIYSSPNIIRMVKSRTMKWAGHIAVVKTKRSESRIWVENPEGKRALGMPGLR
jgi:hypothetical protein